jgi:Domain of unknown function (DUF6321)
MKNLKTFVQELDEAGRCWTGYKPVKGKKPYSPGSCTKEEVEQIDEADTYSIRNTKTKQIYHISKYPITKDNSTYKKIKSKGGEHEYATIHKNGKPLTEEQLEEVAAWQRKEGKSESGGLNQKGVESYRRENPGSKLQTAVTTKPSKLKAGSKASNRRKSFCARMGGMKRRLTSAKTARDPDSRINKALRKWNC